MTNQEDECGARFLAAAGSVIARLRGRPAYNEPMRPDRAVWNVGFPDVLIVVGETECKHHASYRAAKTGDAEAAARLVQDLVSRQALDEVSRLIGGQAPVLASIHAQEADGINAIPEALADFLGLRLGLSTDDAIVQVNVVNHTGASGFARLARQALFEGDVQADRDYLIVDDFIGQGGTIANFRGHLLARGARVLGAVVLTGKPFSARLALSAERLTELRAKHGELEDWWRESFGFGFDALTESEARYLVNTADADTIRDRIASAQQAPDGDNR